MARKIDFENGRPDGDDASTCDNCGRPVHPSLECKACDGGT